MILTFIFTFLKKIKKGEAYITFILYILIFYFFCVEKIKYPGLSRYYYYLPNESKKMAYIDQTFSFYCISDQEKKRCSMMNWTNDPINLHLSIHFTDPQNFFYIMPYVEQYFFNVTGEHIWQTLPKQK